MPAVVVVGAQWGDEGKGKVVDLLAPFADAVVRYAGGANAGHTLVVQGEKRIFHLVPSGALHGSLRCVIGQGTVIDPEVLVAELGWLQERDLLDAGRLLIADRAHVVLPHHKLIDGLREKGNGAIGTTKRGIGPAYEDKAARRGLRMGDLLRPERLRAKLQDNLEQWRPVIESLGGQMPDPAPVVDAYAALGERLRSYVGDAGRWIASALASDEKLLLEGAQGTLLDIDHGTYPYVTSSSAVAGGACGGAGIGPTAVRRVIGIAKAYSTRVGGGPFPTELTCEVGQRLRDAGAEYGSTTGRPRRCGWLDATALRYAARVNGMQELALTKLDVLTGLDEIRIGVGYQLDGQRLDDLPWDEVDRLEPVYESLPGWKEDIAACKRSTDLPANARRYIERIEELTGCEVGLVSVGADRDATLDLTDPFA
ncbi:MAG: adenylosuccinate synthase [Myxococcota bacterium]